MSVYPTQRRQPSQRVFTHRRAGSVTWVLLSCVLLATVGGCGGDEQTTEQAPPFLWGLWEAEYGRAGGPIVGTFEPTVQEGLLEVREDGTFRWSAKDGDDAFLFEGTWKDIGEKYMPGVVERLDGETAPPELREQTLHFIRFQRDELLLMYFFETEEGSLFRPKK